MSDSTGKGDTENQTTKTEDNRKGIPGDSANDLDGKSSEKDKSKNSGKPSSGTKPGIGSLNISQDIVKLEERGIVCKNMQWKHYESESPASDLRNCLADLLITQPPASPSRSFLRSLRNSKSKGPEISFDEVNEFPDFCTRRLLPGGYVILIIQFYQFHEWYEAFFSVGFNVMEYPYVLIKDSKTVPSRKTEKYPQCGNEYALIATSPGRHPKQFSPQFQSSFEHIECMNDCSLAAMTNIPHPKAKLNKPGSRIPFHRNELSALMLSALIDLFSPQGAQILDPYAGTMTTAIAAICTNRKCISIESDELCFRSAVQRLRCILPNGNVDFDIEQDTSIVIGENVVPKPSMEKSTDGETVICDELEESTLLERNHGTVICDEQEEHSGLDVLSTVATADTHIDNGKFASKKATLVPEVQVHVPEKEIDILSKPAQRRPRKRSLDEIGLPQRKNPKQSKLTLAQRLRNNIGL